MVANRIDPEMIERIEVALAFDDPSGWQARDTLIVRAGSEPQTWKVRTSAPDARRFSYMLTHHLKDGAAPIVDAPVESEANAVSVDDPFPHALEIDLVPVWDAGRDPHGVRRRRLQRPGERDRAQHPAAVRRTDRRRAAAPHRPARPHRAPVQLEGDLHRRRQQTTQRPTETTEETLVTLAP